MLHYLTDDTNVTGDEFLQDWEQRKLGDSMEAMILFHNLDVNRDGHINEAIDLPYIVRFFDHYGAYAEPSLRKHFCTKYLILGCKALIER